MAISRATHRWEGEKPLLRKICHTYPTMMKLATVIKLKDFSTKLITPFGFWFSGTCFIF